MNLTKEERVHFLTDRGFFNICVLSQCLVYWINIQNIYTFHIKKYYFMYFCCAFWKSLEAFNVSLRYIQAYFVIISTLCSPSKFATLHIIRRPVIFRTGGIFKTLWSFGQAYSEPCHIQNSPSKQMETYSEPCHIFEIK